MAKKAKVYLLVLAWSESSGSCVVKRYRRCLLKAVHSSVGCLVTALLLSVVASWRWVLIPCLGMP